MTTQPTTPQGTGILNGMMSGITAVNLVLIAVAMLIVLVAIIYGMRLGSQRKAARLEEEKRLSEFEAAPPPPSPEPALAPPAARDVPLAQEQPVIADVPPVARDEPAAVADAAPDVGGPLTQLKGLGPRVAVRLGELGITRLDQLALLDEDAAERLDEQLGPFRGRLVRDRWVEQARFLAAGDRAGFEAVFGKL